MKKFWLAIEKILGIYRWHPKIALRYIPVVEQIKKLGKDKITVLEVGSSGLGIVPYLNKSVVGLDIDFKPPIHPKLIPVKGSILNIPFGNNSFDVVVCMDTLEHVSEADRIRAITELIRVAKKLLCIGVPCGINSFKQDQELARISLQKLGKICPYLHQQLQYGLPKIQWLRLTVTQQAQVYNKKIEIIEQGNINLKLRRILMKGWMSNSWWINIFFRKVLLLFIPILRKFNQEPTYRRLFFIFISS